MRHLDPAWWPDSARLQATAATAAVLRVLAIRRRRGGRVYPAAVRCSAVAGIVVVARQPEVVVTYGGDERDVVVMIMIAADAVNEVHVGLRHVEVRRLVMLETSFT